MAEETEGNAVMDLHAPGRQSRTRTPGSWFPGCVYCGSSPMGLTVSLKQEQAEGRNRKCPLLCGMFGAGDGSCLSSCPSSGIWTSAFAGCHLLESSSLPFN